MAARKVPGGYKCEKRWREAILLAVKREHEDGGKLLNRIATRLVKKAMEGDIAAIKEIGDRIDGKAHQAASMEGDMDLRVTHITRTIVDAPVTR